MDKARASLGALLALGLAGCAALIELGAQTTPPPAPLGDPTCLADSYDFAGEGTLRALGLVGATPGSLPEPDRVAMIWVTHELLPHDLGERGGPVQMTRMLCFEFADGSGGSAWPVDDAWQAPTSAANAEQGLSMPTRLFLVGIVALLAIGGAVVAFRKRG